MHWYTDSLDKILSGCKKPACTMHSAAVLLFGALAAVLCDLVCRFLKIAGRLCDARFWNTRGMTKKDGKYSLKNTMSQCVKKTHCQNDVPYMNFDNSKLSMAGPLGGGVNRSYTTMKMQHSHMFYLKKILTWTMHQKVVKKHPCVLRGKTVHEENLVPFILS